MKKSSLIVIGLMLIMLSSCEIIGDIFKAGMGFGIFLVIAVIGIIIFIIAKATGGNK